MRKDIESFNLVNEPFIPVFHENGDHTELSLRETLRNSSDLVGIRDTDPLVTFGLIRFLCMIIQDALELDFGDISCLGNLLNEAINSNVSPDFYDKIDQYLTRYSHRFDLFDKNYPFLQDPNLAKEKCNKLSVSKLVPYIASGSNPIHFMPKPFNELRCSGKIAAKLLITMPNFSTASGAGYGTSINGQPPWYITLKGRTLLETLLLNCYVGRLPNIDSIGIPYWRTDYKFSKVPKTKFDLFEALWLPTRRVLLIPESEGTCSFDNKIYDIIIKSMYFGPGIRKDSKLEWSSDPNVLYRITKSGIKSVKPQEKYRSWKEFGYTLFNSVNSNLTSRPKVLDQFESMVESGDIPKDYPLSLDIVGIHTDKAKVTGLYNLYLDFPSSIIRNSDISRYLTDTVDYIGKVEYALKIACVNINKCSFTDNITLQQVTILWDTLKERYLDLAQQLNSLSRDNYQDEAVELCRLFKLFAANTGENLILEFNNSYNHNSRLTKVVIQALEKYRNSVNIYTLLMKTC